MTFIMMTLSFTVAILLASFVALVVMLQPKVVKWYVKKTMEMATRMAEDIEKEFEKMGS